MRKHTWVNCVVTVALAACGGDSSGNGDAGNGSDGDGGTDTADAGFGMDAPFSGTCTPGAAQCSNCDDDDGDGNIDGADVECSGPLDNDESSFATGIPGDNVDKTDQDCFFDGNSGQGNDGCSQHTCCLTNSTDKQDCAMDAPAANSNKYDRNECYPPVGTETVPAKCVMVCGGITPPGCDCFGCCTVCNGTGCYDIAINPSVSPGCDETNLQDAAICKRCTKNTMCGNTTCGGDSCVLCPGQTMLPDHCGGQSTCPIGIQPCGGDGTCPTGTYCSIGCCIGTIL